MGSSNFLYRSKDKLLRLSLERLSENEDFGFVRSRIRVVRLFRYFLRERFDLFDTLETFQPLCRSLERFDRSLGQCELVLRRYAVGELSPAQLSALIDDEILNGLDEDISDLEPRTVGDDPASDDAQALMERVWEDIAAKARDLHDALLSVWDKEDFASPNWRSDFEREEAPYLSLKRTAQSVA